MIKQYDELMEEAHERQNFSLVAEPRAAYGADVFDKQMETQPISPEVKTEVKKMRR